MAGFLFDKVIFGPVVSRRFGISLGVNLLPVGFKYCTFDCLYCECGWTHNSKEMSLPIVEVVKNNLIMKLQNMKDAGSGLDNITFAGNGEPTLHPKFDEVIAETVSARDNFYPEAQITVLSNATQLHRPKVFEALKLVDNNVLKLDAGTDKTFKLINQMRGDTSLDQMVDELMRYKGDLIVQTLFLRGEYNNQLVDNTTEEELVPWLNYIKEINPKSVMIYPFERDTPAEDLHRISGEELQAIGKRVEELGIKTKVYC